MKAHIPLALLLLATAVAGCTSEGGRTDATTHVTFDFAGMRADGEQVLARDVPFDPAARPTATVYAIHEATHPDFYSAFDQLDDALRAEEVPYEANYDPRFGFFLASIDGVPGGADAYWSLEVDGMATAVGMGDAQLQAGSEVLWRLTRIETDGAPAASAAADADLLTVLEPEPTAEPTIVVSGQVVPGASLTAKLGSKTLALDPAPDGAFSASFEVPYGHSELRLVADDGTASEEARVTLVRLAQATLEMRYTAAVPPKAGGVWTVTYDPDGFASAPMYEGRDVAHPGTPNVHDLLESWSAAEAKEIQYGYFSGAGFTVDKVDGVGQPVSAAAPPYWCFAVNGETADFGITLMPLAPGDEVLWDYGGAC